MAKALAKYTTEQSNKKINLFLRKLKEKGYMPGTIVHYKAVLKYFIDNPITAQTIKAYRQHLINIKNQAVTQNTEIRYHLFHIRHKGN